VTLYDQALAIAREMGDRRTEALISWRLGEVLVQQGKLAPAIACMQGTSIFFGKIYAKLEAASFHAAIAAITTTRQLARCIWSAKARSRIPPRRPKNRARARLLTASPLFRLLCTWRRSVSVRRYFKVKRVCSSIPTCARPIATL